MFEREDVYSNLDPRVNNDEITGTLKRLSKTTNAHYNYVCSRDLCRSALSSNLRCWYDGHLQNANSFCSTLPDVFGYVKEGNGSEYHFHLVELHSKKSLFQMEVDYYTKILCSPNAVYVAYTQDEDSLIVHNVQKIFA